MRNRQRAIGEVRAEFSAVGSRTELTRLYQTGGLRLAMPNGAASEGVLINTGGGMAGGDRARFDFAIGPGATVTLTTQSAEKIYRSDGDAVRIDGRLSIAAAATLEWLPQEAILFEGAKLVRRVEIEMAGGAELLLVDAVTFGRTAFGESRVNASLRDSWRVRREGRLIFAEEWRLENAAALANRPAISGGARAMALALIVSEEPAAALARLRAAFEASGSAGNGLEWGASGVEQIVIARALSPSPALLRAAIVRVLETLRGRPVPRVWP